MNDYIIRAIAANDQIRAFAAVTTETRFSYNFKIQEIWGCTFGNFQV